MLFATKDFSFLGTVDGASHIDCDVKAVVDLQSRRFEMSIARAAHSSYNIFEGHYLDDEIFLLHTGARHRNTVVSHRNMRGVRMWILSAVGQ